MVLMLGNRLWIGVIGLVGLALVSGCDPNANSDTGDSIAPAAFAGDGAGADQSSELPVADYGGAVVSLGGVGFAEWRFSPESGILEVDFFQWVDGERQPWHIGIAGFGVEASSGETPLGAIKLSAARRVDFGDPEAASAYFQGHSKALLGVGSAQFATPAFLVEGNRIEPQSIGVTLESTDAL